MALLHVYLSMLDEMKTPTIQKGKLCLVNKRKEKKRHERRQAHTDAIAQYLLHRGEIDYPGMLNLDSTDSDSSETETEQSNSTSHLDSIMRLLGRT